MQRVTVFKYSLFPPFKPSLNLLFRQKKKIPHVWSLSMHSCPSFFCNLQNLSAFLFTFGVALLQLSSPLSFLTVYLLFAYSDFCWTYIAVLFHHAHHRNQLFENTKLEDGLFVYTISMKIFRQGATRVPNN